MYRLGWPSIAIALALLGPGSGYPAWGQSEGRLDAQPAAPPLLLAQTGSQPVNRMLFVNPVTGDDQRGEGSLRSPFRSITRAVQFAEPGTVIFLGTGTYDERSGEQFPIVLPPEVRLQNDPSVEQSSIAIAGEVTQGTVAATRPPEVVPEVRSQPAPAVPRTPEPAEPVATTRLPEVVPEVRSQPAPAVSSPSPRRYRTATPAPEPVAIAIPVPPPASSLAAIEIPVPPPVAPSPVPPPRRAAAEPIPALLSLPTTDSPIEIPVPPPENPSPAVERPRSRSSVEAAPPPAQRAAIAPSVISGPYDLLPVPDPNAPLGYTGDMPRVAIANSSPPASVSRGTGGTVSQGAGGLRYRVLVRAEDEQVRRWVRSVVPGAFETVADGETMLQIGAFQSLENAEEAAEQLSRSGIRAIIEEWR